jgi:hypothetical protein
MHRPWHHLNPFHHLEALADRFSGVVHGAYLNRPVSFLVARDQDIPNHDIVKSKQMRRLSWSWSRSGVVWARRRNPKWRCRVGQGEGACSHFPPQVQALQGGPDTATLQRRITGAACAHSMKPKGRETLLVWTSNSNCCTVAVPAMAIWAGLAI